MNNYFTYLKIVTLVLFMCFGLSNQKVTPDKDGSQQFHFNILFPINKNNGAFGINISSINAYKNWSLRYIRYNHYQRKGINLLYLNDTFDLWAFQELNEVALMYGINNNGLKTYISSSIGLGYLIGSIDGGMELDGDENKYHPYFYNSIGISLDSEILVRIFPGFGFGLKSVGHINKEFGFWNWAAMLHYRLQ